MQHENVGDKTHAEVAIGDAEIEELLLGRVLVVLAGFSHCGRGIFGIEVAHVALEGGELGFPGFFVSAAHRVGRFEIVDFGIEPGGGALEEGLLGFEDGDDVRGGWMRGDALVDLGFGGGKG